MSGAVSSVRKSNSPPRRRRGPQDPWSDSEILEALRKYAVSNGRSLRYKDWILAGDDHPAAQTVSRRFGTWANALALVGLLPRKGGPTPFWTESRIIVALNEEFQRPGSPPTSTDWTKGSPDHPTSTHVQRVFGSFESGLRAASIEPTPVYPSLEQIKEALKAFIAENGVVPGSTEWARRGMRRPSASQILRVCGSWSAALQLAGAEGPAVRRRTARDPWPKSKIVLALTRARAMERPGSKKRWRRAEDDHPNERTVRLKFDNWTNVNAAAGFSNQEVDGPPGLLDFWRVEDALNQRARD